MTDNANRSPTFKFTIRYNVVTIGVIKDDTIENHSACLPYTASTRKIRAMCADVLERNGIDAKEFVVRNVETVSEKREMKFADALNNSWTI